MFNIFSVGTKTLLFGYHQIFLHGILVALGWKRVYGKIPRDPRIWFSFFLHDIGYFGCKDIDGPSGENHPEFGARIMDFLFGKEWGDFCRGHSKSYAIKKGIRISSLYAADKMASAILPVRNHVFLLKITGELKQCLSDTNTACPIKQALIHRQNVYRNVVNYMRGKI